MGAVKRLQEDISRLVPVHCCAHRVELAITVVSRASAHGCSTISLRFHHTGRLPCVKIEIGDVDLRAWCLHVRYVYARRIPSMHTI